MASHIYHPEDIHDAGLQDGCERCNQLAHDPFVQLDDRMLGALIDRVLDDNGNARSRAEAAAMGIITNHIMAARRMDSISSV